MNPSVHITPTPAPADVLPFPGPRERLARRGLRELIEIRGDRLGVTPADRRAARIAANRVLTSTGAFDRARATAWRVLRARSGVSA